MKTKGTIKDKKEKIKDSKDIKMKTGQEIVSKEIKEDKKLKIKEEKEIIKDVKNVKELQQRIIKEKSELNKLNMQKARFTLKNTSLLRQKRDQIARLFTALRKAKE